MTHAGSDYVQAKYTASAQVGYFVFDIHNIRYFDVPVHGLHGA